METTTTAEKIIALLFRYALRQAWEHGISTAKHYGDNVHHLVGEQADRRFAEFLEKELVLDVASFGSRGQ